LPGKNKRVLVDRPLALHSIACAQRLDGIRHILFSTDDADLAGQAREAGAYVPSLRPTEYATDSAPMADVIRHAMTLLDAAPGSSTDYLLLLDPTSPLRDPLSINDAAQQLRDATNTDGVVSISIPSFNPLWVGVELGEGSIIRRHSATPHVFTRRQDAPAYWRINGSFYLWRNEFAREIEADWLDQGSFIGFETPEILSHSIDTLNDFRLVEVLLASQFISIPWLGDGHDH
jgi:N-acylneuraminate cytidylyltransferase